MLASGFEGPRRVPSPARASHTGPAYDIRACMPVDVAAPVDGEAEETAAHGLAMHAATQEGYTHAARTCRLQHPSTGQCTGASMLCERQLMMLGGARVRAVLFCAFLFFCPSSAYYHTSRCTILTRARENTTTCTHTHTHTHAHQRAHTLLHTSPVLPSLFPRNLGAIHDVF